LKARIQPFSGASGQEQRSNSDSSDFHYSDSLKLPELSGSGFFLALSDFTAQTPRSARSGPCCVAARGFHAHA
jgi:hypothetical protein